MSGLIKGIGKVFKKVGNFVKKNWKYIAMAVAVYFTAGIALSYFGATAGFAAAMPGFGTGGMFTSAASAIGFNGPAIAGAAIDAATASGMISAGAATWSASNSAMALGAFKDAAIAAGVKTSTLAAAYNAGHVSMTAGVAADGTASYTGVTVTEAGAKAGLSLAPVGEGATGATGGANAAAVSNVNAETGANFAETLEGGGAGGGGGGGAAGKGGAEVAKTTLAKTSANAAPQYGYAANSDMNVAMIKSMQTTQRLAYASTALNVAAGLTTPEDKGPYAFGVSGKGVQKGGDAAWMMGDSFKNMNKNTQAAGMQPQGSQWASSGGDFLKTPFDTGGGDYDPQAAARDFIGA